MDLPTYADIEAAAARLGRLAVRTPLIEAPVLNERVGGRVLLKAENLQRVGAFKFRGAYNAISQIDRDAYPGGVVACSSGNHAQGVACAASLLDLPAVIVMPRDAPETKRRRTAGYGAEIVLYDRDTEDRQAIAERIAQDRGMAFVHPYDDPRVIAGQGTVGRELMQQAAAVGATPDAVLVCCSGGGLTAGVSIAVKAVRPSTRIHTVEPAGFDDFARSLAAGETMANATTSGSICDALMSPTPGERTFAIGRRNFSAGLAVTDDEVRAAMRFAFAELKLVLEPGGAVALAAVLSGKITAKDHTTVCVLSGGNVEPSFFAEVITDAE
jgi:threonine dehydratase